MGKNVAGSHRVGKEIRLLAGEAAFVGVDVHKKTYSVCVWTERREWVAHGSRGLRGRPHRLRAGAGGVEDPRGTRAGAELRGLPLLEELRFCLDLLLDDLDHGRAKLIAAARHLAILLWHLVTTESTYTPGEATARDPEPVAAEA